MIIGRLSRLAIAAVLVMGATSAIGWPGVPVTAVVVVLPLSRHRLSAAESALAASLAWGALLAWTTTQGPLGIVATLIGGVLTLPAAAVVVLTLALPAGFAWSAATLATAVTSRLAVPSRAAE
ncbi:MAG: hypothetical protein NVS9B3_02670 [Gemmatimonadaceae bacterium]